MKKKLLLTLFVHASVVINVIAQTNVLHLNLGSHNETNDPSYGVSYTTNYATIKSKILEIADSVDANDAKWNMQVESNFVLECIQQETAGTNPNDIIQTMDNLLHVEVDPHNHLDTNNIANPGYNPYNYADLAHLLDSCGLTTRTNVGGFLYKATDWETADGNWTQWKYGLAGRTFPWHTWTPTMLWGGGTPGHTNDPYLIGVWHPAGATTLSFLNNASTNLLDMGNGCGWIVTDSTDVPALLVEIGQYISVLNSTSPSTNTFNTATVMFNFRNILATNTISKISEFLRGMKTHVTNGDVVWQTLSEKRADWLSAHNNTTDNYLIECGSLSVGVAEEKQEEEIAVFPNPSTSLFTIQSNDEIISIEIFDVCGKMILNEIVDNETIKTLNLQSRANGIYFAKIYTSKGVSTKRIIINKE